MKLYFDKGRTPREFKEGDHVYLKRSAVGTGRVLPDTRKGQGGKLRTPFLGPFKIIRRKRDVHTYVLDMPFGSGHLGNQWHVSYLVGANPEGSAFDSPKFLESPQAVLANAFDLHNMVRYLTVWNDVGDHSWELEGHLKEHKRGRDLVSAYRRRWGKDIPSTSEHPLLEENPHWLEEVME